MWSMTCADALANQSVRHAPIHSAACRLKITRPTQRQQCRYNTVVDDLDQRLVAISRHAKDVVQFAGKMAF